MSVCFEGKLQSARKERGKKAKGADNDSSSSIIASL